ncbi:hypothetical protein EDC04DRAFT_2628204 [Pisolithus marmoratus]|nr:hypothetical protein EDC04DRAFT_2628204 [Pisolithus marmoratus]
MFNWTLLKAPLAPFMLVARQGSTFEVDANVPMPPLPNEGTLLRKFPTPQSIARHGIGKAQFIPCARFTVTSVGCLIIAEHSYFLMQHGHHVWKEVLTLAVEEYAICNMQAVIAQAVKAVFHDHNDDMDNLCGAIIKVIIENRMSNKLLMGPGSK